MNKVWNQATIQQYIDDEIQESLTLDYKAADALGKRDEKKREITKDVSAMANSSGGVIIYGIAEYDAAEEGRSISRKAGPNQAGRVFERVVGAGDQQHSPTN